jgi:hypothetical protein
MKVLFIALAVSAATNAVLLAAFISKPSLAPTSVRSYFEFGSSSPRGDEKKSAVRPVTQRGAAATPLWTNLQAEELTTLVGRLRAAGFPPTIVRAIVEAELERRFSGRLKDLTRNLQDTPYWKPDPSYYMGNSQLFEQINQIYRERSKMMRELLGKDALAYGHMDPNAAQRRQFGNLSQQKIDLVQRIVDDYAEMTSQIRQAMQGITLPEDREKLALLEREKRADLAAILNPEELADYEMRTSNITGRLRTAFTIMDATEAEFRALYGIHQPYAELLYPTTYMGFTADMSEKRREAQQAIADQAKATLGEKRFAEYQRATNSEFQQLYRLGQRDGLPYDTLVRAYDVRGPAAEASTRIINDPSLSLEQKRTALTELAQKSRTQLLSTLGPVVGPAYADSNRWLSFIQQGGAVTIMPDGNLSYRHPPPPPSAAGTKGKP